MYKFSNSLNYPLNMIHPYQLSKVQGLLHTVFSPDIKKIIIFGSSVTRYFLPTSDLDICVLYTGERDSFEVYEEMHSVCKVFFRKFDLLVFNEDEFDEENSVGSIEREIKKTGVVIYAKKESVLAG